MMKKIAIFETFRNKLFHRESEKTEDKVFVNHENGTRAGTEWNFER